MLLFIFVFANYVSFPHSDPLQMVLTLYEDNIEKI